MTAPARADALARLLGAPPDAAVLDADERAEPWPEGERILAEYGLGAEFVPVAHGGRLDRFDHLVEVLRSVYRRDPALGLGYGVGSFIAAAAVWTAGDERQTASAARTLLSGGRIAAAFHETAHGNDLAAVDCAATPTPDGLLLHGRKEVVANIGRAEALVVFARTDPRPGPRAHSLLLLDRATVRDATDLPRHATTGMRGVLLGGLDFDHVPVPADSVLGGLGTGLETALKAFQVTRATLPAMATGVLDTALRIAVDHLSTRRLYGGTALDLPHVRSVLAGVFTDLLRAEVFAAVALRALHLAPGSAGLYSAAVKIAVPRLLLDAVDRLADLLGAHFYLRGGPSGLFQKLLRDLAPVGFGHVARAACQSTLLPQLPRLAARGWTTPTPVPDGLFTLDGDLPPAAFDRFTLHAGGRDPLAAAVADEDRPDLADLAASCASLRPADLGVTATPAHYDLTTRYVRLLARTTWRRAHLDHPARGFLADPAWSRAALHRSDHPRVPLPEPLAEAVLGELLERHRAGRSFGLTARTPTARPDSREE
ncbi:acyl-CoA dehydrogenase family protein [Actinosynnema sp. NPDC020468]|uniref:acyl-CoA dehydrogenase family protein n=1 Tax=Actinosynnema sp. NPDC020468 TaxID=3154488 RepID=UPI0033F6A83E